MRTGRKFLFHDEERAKKLAEESKKTEKVKPMKNNAHRDLGPKENAHSVLRGYVHASKKISALAPYFLVPLLRFLKKY